MVISLKYKLMLLALLFLANTLLAIAFYNQDSVQKPRIIFLDVGQGDAIVIEASNNTQILIDGGSGKNILDKLGKYMPFYDRKIELVIMTHPDKDHMGGLVEVLKYYQVGEVLQTGIFCDTAICEEWDKLISEKNIPVKYAEFGQKITTRGIDVAVFYPFENFKDKKVKNDNDTSIVIRVETGGNSFLLMGDAGFGLENELMSNNINIESRILKVSHHGSKNATSNDFLQAVMPEAAIISVGKNNYGHPADELLNRLKNMNLEIFRTDKTGDLVFY